MNLFLCRSNSAHHPRLTRRKVSTPVTFALVAMLGMSCARETPPVSPTFQPVVTILTPQPTTAPVAAQPTNTPLVLPTATSINVQASLAPSPTPTPNIPALPENANPFTGLPMDSAKLNRRPVFIKVANTAEVRPQSGLSGADVVFEHLTEGDITRFAALFLTNDVNKIGSVRSCRLIDVELPAIFDAALVCSGTSPGVKPIIRDSIAHKDNRTMISDFGPYECLSPCTSLPMFRSDETVAPHNLFASTTGARKELDSRKKNDPSKFRSWSFNATAPTAGIAANQVSIPYRSGTVGWSYNASNGLYARSLQGVAQTDRANGKAIAVANVIVVYANHVFTDIVEDATGAKSIQIQLWGQGPVTIMRDGKAIDGQWKRTANQSDFVFVDNNGTTISLKPGNAWVQLVPLNYGVTVK